MTETAPTRKTATLNDTLDSAVRSAIIYNLSKLDQVLMTARNSRRCGFALSAQACNRTANFTLHAMAFLKPILKQAQEQ